MNIYIWKIGSARGWDPSSRSRRQNPQFLPKSGWRRFGNWLERTARRDEFRTEERYSFLFFSLFLYDLLLCLLASLWNGEEKKDRLVSPILSSSHYFSVVSPIFSSNYFFKITSHWYIYIFFYLFIDVDFRMVMRIEKKNGAVSPFFSHLSYYCIYFDFYWKGSHISFIFWHVVFCIANFWIFVTP